MSLLRIAATLFSILAFTIAAYAVDPRSTPPNVVVILADDLGWRDMGCTGSDLYRTPNIDSLADQGMLFTQAYAAAPICSPSRASILTGQHPARLGMTDWLPGRKDMASQKLLRPSLTDHLPEESITLAEALRARGYATVHIGKWHLGGVEYGPEKNGFDVNVGGTQAGSPTGGYFNFAAPTLNLEPGEYLTDRLTTEAIRFIDQHKDRPFFVYLAHYAVHIPLQAKEDVTRRYRGLVKNDAVHTNPLYAAMVESVDDSVGAMMKNLADLKLLENTIVIFTSDNGGLSVREGPNTPSTSNSPLRGGKGHLYEGGVRVPLIVSWPAGVKPGSTCDVPVIGSDLYATLVAAADAKGNEVLDGDNLLPLLRQQKSFRPRSLYWHYPHYSNQGGKPSSAIRDGDWKLIEFFEDSRKELYNLKDDPREQHDLCAHQPQKTKELAAKLNRWQSQVGAKMPTANPDYRAN